jgi:hypothetical protein
VWQRGMSGGRHVAARSGRGGRGGRHSAAGGCKKRWKHRRQMQLRGAAHRAPAMHASLLCTLRRALPGRYAGAVLCGGAGKGPHLKASHSEMAARS